eukprot:scaffold1012_cov162-Pinguiococcus_pyrenoidosus.AAC.1
MEETIGKYRKGKARKGMEWKRKGVSDFKALMRPIGAFSTSAYYCPGRQTRAPDAFFFQTRRVVGKSLHFTKA